MKRPLWWPTWLEDPTWLRVVATAVAFVATAAYSVWFWGR